MEVRWVEDPSHIDCWDLMRGDVILAYIMRPRGGRRVLGWSGPGAHFEEAPSQDVEEAKAVIQAMVLLEG